MRLRQRVIDSSTELRERELIKFAELTKAIADALSARGTDELAAQVTAQTGIAVFSMAWTRWSAPGNDRPFTELMDDSLQRLRNAVGAAQ